MANIGRMIGVNIYALIQKKNIEIETFMVKMNYSIKDIWNIIEGKVILSPSELDKIADLLGTTKEHLMEQRSDVNVPELQYMKEFSNPNNLDRIIDLMDEYVECLEAI